MSLSRRMLLPLFAMSIASPIAAAAPKTEPALPQRLDAVIDRALREQRVVGAVVLVAKDGKVVYRRAAGLGDREADRPMREDAIFRLASVTKPFVTVAALRLVEAGKLQLADPVTRWLPDFTPKLADGSTPLITVHQLLTHSAGLTMPGAQPDTGPYHRLGVSDGLDHSGITLDEEVRRLAAVPLSYAPGSEWRYSVAIDVLGAVVARANGTTLQKAIAQLVTTPLQLRDAAFSVKDSPRMTAAYADGTSADGKKHPQRMSDGFDLPLPKELGGFRLRFDPGRAFDADAFPSGGAGMVGTADDVLTLLETIRSGGGTLLRAETVARMTTDHVGIAAQAQGPGWGFGYGGAVLDDPALAHSPQGKGTLQWGGVYGASWFVDRANGWTVVALTNTTLEGMSGAFPTQVRDAVYGGR